MDAKDLKEIFHEFIDSMEKMDTQNSAISQFLKDKGVVDPKDLAPYMEQAGNASGVRWLGVRVRIDHLLSSAIQSEEDEKAEDAVPKKETKSEAAGKQLKDEATQNDTDRRDTKAVSEEKSQVKSTESNPERDGETDRDPGDETQEKIAEDKNAA
jgi:hypothetical protein